MSCTPIEKQQDLTKEKRAPQALVVEDQEGVRAVVSTVLELEGYKVTCANDGIAGWDQFRQSPERWDIVVLDVMMPGMNGIDLDDHIQALRPGMPTVVMTGYASNEVMAGLKRRSRLELLLKPFALKEIRRCISNVRAPRPIRPATDIDPGSLVNNG